MDFRLFFGRRVFFVLFRWKRSVLCHWACWWCSGLGNGEMYVKIFKRVCPLDYRPFRCFGVLSKLQPRCLKTAKNERKRSSGGKQEEGEEEEEIQNMWVCVPTALYMRVQRGNCVPGEHVIYRVVRVSSSVSFFPAFARRFFLIFSRIFVPF